LVHARNTYPHKKIVAVDPGGQLSQEKHPSCRPDKTAHRFTSPRPETYPALTASSQKITPALTAQRFLFKNQPETEDDRHMEASDTTTQRNYYDDLARRAVGHGHSLEAAIEQAASAYLDGKPATQGKRKFTRRERDSQFWLSRTVKDCPTSAWSTEPMVLALARYLSQKQLAVEGLINAVARIAPDALIRAVRYSGHGLLPVQLTPT
jgi:hypothetical protein